MTHNSVTALYYQFWNKQNLGDYRSRDYFKLNLRQCQIEISRDF